MHERAKLDNAAYFLGRMKETQTNVNAFRAELSAFLSEGRSVLQYARKEAANPEDAPPYKVRNPAGEAWYVKMLSTYPVAKFMKDARDESIHSAPVVPNNNVTIKPQGFGMVMGTGQDWQTIQTKAPPPPIAEYEYWFENDPTKRSVLDVARDYLAALRAIVADGQAKGFLTTN